MNDADLNKTEQPESEAPRSLKKEEEHTSRSPPTLQAEDVEEPRAGSSRMLGSNVPKAAVKFMHAQAPEAAKTRVVREVKAALKAALKPTNAAALEDAGLGAFRVVAAALEATLKSADIFALKDAGTGVVREVKVVLKAALEPVNASALNDAGLGAVIAVATGLEAALESANTSTSEAAGSGEFRAVTAGSELLGTRRSSEALAARDMQNEVARANDRAGARWQCPMRRPLYTKRISAERAVTPPYRPILSRERDLQQQRAELNRLLEQHGFSPIDRFNRENYNAIIEYFARLTDEYRHLMSLLSNIIRLQN